MVQSAVKDLSRSVFAVLFFILALSMIKALFLFGQQTVNQISGHLYIYIAIKDRR
jgi:hypothetical protein